MSNCGNDVYVVLHDTTELSKKDTQQILADKWYLPTNTMWSQHKNWFPLISSNFCSSILFKLFAVVAYKNKKTKKTLTIMITTKPCSQTAWSIKI